MGIVDPSKSSSHEHDASVAVTKNLTQIIFNQENDFTNYKKEDVKKQIYAVKAQKEERLKKELKQIRQCKNEENSGISPGNRSRSLVFDSPYSIIGLYTK